MVKKDSVLRNLNDMNTQFAFYMDTNACVGCKACQIACQDKHDLPAEILWRRVVEYVDGSWNIEGERLIPKNILSYYVSMACNHCERPLCIEACPTEAIFKRSKDGIVLIDYDECTGCRDCESACPYGALQYNADTGLMTKCTLCHDLLFKSENPVCVDACTMRVLGFGELNELRAEFGDTSAVEPLPDADLTGPSLVLTPHRHARLSAKGC